MPAWYVEPAPRKHLNVTDLLDRWPVVSRQAVSTWFRNGRLKGKKYGAREMWCCTEAEAARWEIEHPRLRALVQEREAKGGAAHT